jgi:hypothetical protein
MTNTDWWNYISPILGILLGVLGTFLVEKWKDRATKQNILKTIECVELVNTRLLDEKSLGPIKEHVHITLPKGGPGSELIEVKELYFARYRFRNLSDEPVQNIVIATDGHNNFWSSLSERDGDHHPDFWLEFNKKMKRGSANYPFPYINPHKTTQHEIYLDVSSYLPLDGLRISGGAQGVKFIFKKINNVAS